MGAEVLFEYEGRRFDGPGRPPMRFAFETGWDNVAQMPEGSNRTLQLTSAGKYFASLRSSSRRT